MSEGDKLHLDEAAHRIAEQLAKPVVVYDAGLNVITFSVHEGEVDRGRLAIILNRRATPRAADMIAQSNARNSREPVVLPAYADVPARVLMPLRHDGRLYGYLAFSEPGAIDDVTPKHYAEQLDEASETLGAILAVMDLEQRDTTAMHRRLAEDLLGTDSAAKTLAIDSLLSRGLIAKSDRYAVVVIRYRTTDLSANAQRLELETQVQQVARSSVFTGFGSTFGAYAVVVIPGAVDLEQLDGLLARNAGSDLMAGVGGERSELSLMGESLREAQIACEAAIRIPGYKARAAAWHELGLDRILLQLPLNTLKLTDLPDGVVKLLSVESGIDLARTLNSYLSVGGEAQETARRLHIHRSTLYYRLDKIREITGLDLTDGNVRRDIHTGLRIAQLAGFWAA